MEIGSVGHVAVDVLSPGAMGTAIAASGAGVRKTRAVGSAPEAWRFVGEMKEIGKALADVGLPDGFFRAAAEVYERLSGFKDTEELIELAEVAEVLRGVREL